MYLFLRDTEVFLEYKDTIYKMEVAEISVSATIRETTTEAADFFSKDRFERSAIFEKNPVDFSMRFAAHTSNPLDIELFLSPDQTELRPFSIYLKNKDCITYRILNCIVDSTSLSVTKQALLYLSVAGKGAVLEESNVTHHPSLPYTDRLNTSNYIRGIATAKLNDETLYNIESISINKQIDVQWVNNNNLYLPRNTLFYSNTPVYEGTVFSGNILFTTPDRLENYSENCGLEFIIDDRLFIYLYPCAYTTRFETGDLYKVSLDFKVVESGSLTSEVHYNEFENPSC